MALSYDEAVALLHQAPLESFVEQRKRLASQLKSEGDKAGAARLTARGRPPVSAWVVNQLWWQAREDVEALFAATARQRAGDRAAAAEHRERLARLRSQAAELLRAAGHGVSEGTLRRVTATLAALSVSGSFEPDSPGALGADRDPPGFDALTLGDVRAFSTMEQKGAESTKASKTSRAEGAANVNDAAGDAQAPRASARRAAEEAAEQRRRQAEEERERQKKEAERARVEAEGERLKGELSRARTEFDACERAASERRQELRAAEAAAERARLELNAARARLKDFERSH